MWKDPIVEKVRKAGARLAASADFDLHKLFDKLRDGETKARAEKTRSSTKAKPQASRRQQD